MKRLLITMLACTAACVSSVNAQAQRTWDRQYANLVVMGGRGVVTPAPPIAPHYALKEIPWPCQFDWDQGTRGEELKVWIPCLPDLLKPCKALLVNNEDLLATWKLYGDRDAEDDRAWIRRSFSSTQPNTLISRAVYYSDYLDPYPPADLPPALAPIVVGGRWKLLAPDRTHATIHWEYDFTADVTGDATFITYHWGSFAIKRSDPNRPSPRPVVNAFEVWHSGLTLEYKVWEWFGGFPGMPAMPMGDTVFYAFSPYGQNVSVDSFVPYGVDNSEVLDLAKADDHSLERVVIPGVEYVAVTSDQPNVTAKGGIEVYWTLEVTAAGAYSPPGATGPGTGPGPGPGPGTGTGTGTDTGTNIGGFNLP